MPKKKSNSIERDSEKLRFPLFQNIVLVGRTSASVVSTEQVDWACFLKFHCHIILPSKVTGCSISFGPRILWNSLDLFSKASISQKILKLWKFSCQIAHYGKGLIAVFRGFFASINKFFILTGRLGTRLSFYQF